MVLLFGCLESCSKLQQNTGTGAGASGRKEVATLLVMRHQVCMSCPMLRVRQGYVKSAKRLLSCDQL